MGEVCRARDPRLNRIGAELPEHRHLYDVLSEGGSDFATAQAARLYQILSPLGEGGMGSVWKARDSRLDSTVAIKVSKAGFDDRFEREARALSQITIRDANVKLAEIGRISLMQNLCTRRRQ